MSTKDTSLWIFLVMLQFRFYDIVRACPYWSAFLCIVVEVGLEKRRYLLLQAMAQQKLSIRYVFHGAGASHRNNDAQKGA